MIKTNTLPDIYDKKKNKEEKIKKKVKKDKYYVHEETSNLSFLKMYRALSLLKIENNDFFLKLYDTRLVDIDPFDPDLTLEEQTWVFKECTRNYWYFVREIVRIPVAGSDVGGGKPYELHRGNLAIGWCLTHNLNFFIELPRQNFKTMSIMIALLWLYNFGTSNSNMMLIHKDHKGAKDNLATIRSVRSTLPEYLRFDTKFNAENKELKLTENVEDAYNPKTHNKMVTFASATSAERADLLGRGATQPVQNYDEYGFLRFNKIIYEAASPAAQQAAIEADANGKPHCKMISTTPGDMNTQYGKDAKAFRDACAEFKEEFYDWDITDIKQTLDKNSDNDFFRISFTYRQLGRSEQYFKDVSKALNGNRFKIRREILLEWLIVNEDPIFNETSLNTLMETAKERTYKTVWIDKLYRLDLYEKINPMDTYIVSCDCAGGTLKDNSTLVITNSKTKAVAGEFKCNSIDTTSFSYMIYSVCTQVVKNCMVVIERNNVGISVITNLLKTNIKNKLYYEQNTKDYQDKIKNGREVESDTATRNYGLWTDENKKIQMHEILVKYVDTYPTRLATQMMAEELNSLIYNSKHQIDHPPDGHDDLVMGYLIGMWVYHYGKNLARYGIFKVPDIDPSSGLSDEEAIQDMMQEQEEREAKLNAAYFEMNRDKKEKQVVVKTMADLYAEIDQEALNNSNRLNNTRNINDLLNVNTTGLQSNNIFNTSGRRGNESNAFANNLVNNILGGDL